MNISEGTKKNPVQLDPFQLIVKVNWISNPPTIILTGIDQQFVNSISSTRRTLNFYNQIVSFVIAFTNTDAGENVFAVITSSGVFASEVNLFPFDPYLTSADSSDTVFLSGGFSPYNGDVPYGGEYDPPKASDPGYAMHSPPQTPPFDFTKPIKMNPTKLITVGIIRIGTGARDAANSLYGSQGAITYETPIMISFNVTYAEGTFHAGDIIPAGTYHDVGYQELSYFKDLISAFPQNFAVKVYKGGTFTVDHSNGSIGPKGTITVSRDATLLFSGSRSYDVFNSLTILDKFNKSGFVV